MAATAPPLILVEAPETDLRLDAEIGRGKEDRRGSIITPDQGHRRVVEVEVELEDLTDGMIAAMIEGEVKGGGKVCPVWADRIAQEEEERDEEDEGEDEGEEEEEEEDEEGEGEEDGVGSMTGADRGTIRTTTEITAAMEEVQGTGGRTGVGQGQEGMVDDK